MKFETFFSDGTSFSTHNQREAFANAKGKSNNINMSGMILSLGETQRILTKGDGFFFGSKAVVLDMTGAKTQINLVGLGNWNKDQEKFKVSWYRAESLDLDSVEWKNFEEAKPFMVLNNANEQNRLEATASV